MPKALIVEDHQDQADVVAELLRHKGFEPMIAATGTLGLKLAFEHRPDLILLDLMLADIDGFEVCRKLRCEPETLTIPIVMVTALNGNEYRTQGFRVGANAYLTKPYGAQDLYHAIASAISWRDRLDKLRLKGEIQLEMHSESSFLDEVNEFLANLSAKTPLAPDQTHQLRQALMELGQNAIEWGNRHERDALVNITYRIYDEYIEIIIADQGPGFDPDSLEHAASPDDPLAHIEVREKLGLREGGFGMLIARGMVDEMTYNNSGNEVTLIKRFRRD